MRTRKIGAPYMLALIAVLCHATFSAVNAFIFDDTTAKYLDDRILKHAEGALFYRSDAHSMNPTKLSGFQFCKHLDGSWFDSNAQLDYTAITLVLKAIKKDHGKHLKKLKTFSYYFKAFFSRIWNLMRHGKWRNTASPRLRVEDLIALYPEIVDALATHLMERHLKGSMLAIIPRDIRSPNLPVSAESSRRFACYVAAEGANSWVNIVSRHWKRRIIQFVDGQTYFNRSISFSPFQMRLAEWEAENVASCPSIVEPQVGNPSSRSEDGKLAFILMIHKDLEATKLLVTDLAGSRSTVLIHVDGTSPKLRADLQLWLIRTYEIGSFDPKRVKIMTKSINGAWGHASLVHIQLEAMFELLDMNLKWEYVINMSSNDVLLQNHDEIYRLLSAYGDANWIYTYFRAPRVSAHMYRLVLLSNKDMAGIWLPPNGHISESERELGELRKQVPNPYVKWQNYKNHQWMILHRSTPKNLRKSPTAMFFLAATEFMNVPDEFYIGSLLRNMPFYDVKVQGKHIFHLVNKRKRYLQFVDRSVHPRFLTITDSTVLENAVKSGDIIARKVDVIQETNLMTFIHKRRIENWN